MTGFLSKAACHGHRPTHLASRRHYARPDLIARLLRERHVARFLVAPDGFGKTGLALEYADTVFSFEHVFWINGRSPCFLRDLDRDIIASTLVSCDDHPFLAVIEDVPLLDAARTVALSATFDALLEQGCEVLATCTPTSDAYMALQHDRLKLSASDLLLADAELDVVRSPDERASCPVASVPVFQRVPGLRWGASDDGVAFLTGAAREEMPADLLLAVGTMLVLRTGTLSDIVTFGPCNKDLITMLTAGYPYLGIDRRCARFETPDFPVAVFARAFGGKIDAMASRSRFKNRDNLVIHWADALVARASCERACGLVKALCSQTSRMSWLATRSRELMRQGCVLPAHELYTSIGTSAKRDLRLEIGEALRLVVLGDDAAALLRARRLGFDPSMPDEVRSLALIIIARYGHGEMCEKANEELVRLAHVPEGCSSLDLGKPDGGHTRDELFWRPLVLAQVAFARDVQLLVNSWDGWCAGGADVDALVLAASWALSAAIDGRSEGKSGDGSIGRVLSFDGIGHFVQERLKDMDGSSSDLFVAMAGLALERAREQGVVSKDAVIGAVSSLMIHRIEMELFSQCRAFERAVHERDARRAEYAATHPDAFLDGWVRPDRVKAATIMPLLTVNLFGGLDVYIGDDPIDMRRFRRQKVKTLLALLVINRGREFPRDRLVDMLWPHSDIECGRKNFYSIWSQLRRVLSLPSGSCPYLVRQQRGCRLAEHLLVSDVVRFDDACRMLLFGEPGAEGWSRLYAEIDNAFADDLMPSEVDNDLIVQTRRDCRMKLVDALVAAAERLVAEGKPQEGLWFARAALKRDRSREDAYTVLMQAQIAAGQRTAALETYFACRRFLTSELGIDPSLMTMTLYHSIIETEETLD